MRAVFLSLVLSLSLLAAETPVSPARYVPVEDGHARADVFVAPGDGFLVAWDERTFGLYPGPVYVRTYDAAGNARQPVEIQIGEHYGHSPHAIWNGSEYLLVYANWLSRFGSSIDVPLIESVLVRADGSVVERSRNTLALAHVNGGIYAIAWNGSEAGVLVNVNGERHLLRLDRLGQLLSDERVDDSSRSIAPKGDDFLVYDADALAEHDGTYAAVRRLPQGPAAELLDAEGNVTASFLLVTGGIDARSLAWDGDAWVTSYAYGDAVCIARFTSAADIRSDCTRTGATPFVTHGEGRTFAAWVSARDRNQVLTDGGVASTIASPQLQPAATVDANGLLVAWIEDARIHLGGPGREERVLENPIDVDSPQLAINAAGQTLLVYHEASRIYAMRLDRDSRVELGIGAEPHVVARGNDWLVTFRSAKEIVSTLVSANGDANGLQRFGGTAWQYESAVAATDEGFLVLWNEGETFVDGDVARIVVERLTPGGLRVSGGIRLVDEQDRGTFTSPPQSWLHNPAIGCNAERCLVAWTRENQLEAMLIRHDGTPITAAYRVGETQSFVRPRVIVRARADGGFDIYAGGRIVTPAGTRMWSSDVIAIGDVVSIGGRDVAVYQRAGRVWFRDFPPRVRAVAH